MRLVIDIDDEIYKEIYNEKGDWGNYVSALIRTGTPLPKRQWIKSKFNGMDYIECSECSSWFLRMNLTRNRYCPNCGAKMESEDNHIK